MQAPCGLCKAASQKLSMQLYPCASRSENDIPYISFEARYSVSFLLFALLSFGVGVKLSRKYQDLFDHMTIEQPGESILFQSQSDLSFGVNFSLGFLFSPFPSQSRKNCGVAKLLLYVLSPPSIVLELWLCQTLTNLTLFSGRHGAHNLVDYAHCACLSRHISRHQLW